MGRIILLIIILFALYWARELYIQGKKAKDKRNEPESEPVSNSKVDELIAEYNQKIADIESKSQEEIKASEGKINYYKQELEKLNKLKNK